MKREDLRIERSCDEDWDAMDGDERRRHCEQCEKDVLNLAAVPEREALKILEAQKHGDQTRCLRVATDREGNLKFGESTRQIERQQSGVRQLLGAVALAAPLALVSACQDGSDPADAPQPRENQVASPVTPSVPSSSDKSDDDEAVLPSDDPANRPDENSVAPPGEPDNSSPTIKADSPAPDHPHQEDRPAETARSQQDPKPRGDRSARDDNQPGTVSRNMKPSQSEHGNQKWEREEDSNTASKSDETTYMGGLEHDPDDNEPLTF